MNSETAVLNVKREQFQGLPPFVRKYGQLLKPPIKTERLLSPATAENPSSSNCPQEVRNLVEEIEAPTLSQTEPSLNEVGSETQTICPKEVVIRLKRIKTYTKSNVSSSSCDTDQDHAVPKRTVVISLTRLGAAVSPVLGLTTLNTIRSVKTESGEGRRNDRSPTKLTKILKLRLERIDDNILFHIRINNPDAAYPPPRTSVAVPEVPLFQYTPGNRELFNLKLERFHDQTLDDINSDLMDITPIPQESEVLEGIKVGHEGSQIDQMPRRRRGRPPKQKHYRTKIEAEKEVKHLIPTVTRWGGRLLKFSKVTERPKGIMQESSLGRVNNGSG